MNHFALSVPVTGDGADLFNPDGNNADRVEWATQAIEAFQAATGTDDEDAVKDLLCDLIHYCHDRDEDFSACLNAAIWHFEAETSEEDF